MADLARGRFCGFRSAQAPSKVPQYGLGEGLKFRIT